jgi:universal stress protein A
MQAEYEIDSLFFLDRRGIERILCPIDDLVSESDQAFRYSVALARAYGAKLFVLHCEKEITPERKLHIQRLVEDSLCPQIIIADPPCLDWECITVEGDITSAITREAAEHRIDMIVMRSRRPFTSLLLWSVTEAVCRTAPCPVLVIHPCEREWVSYSTGIIDLEQVLVATDFSECSALALSNALPLAEKFKAKVHLLHVLQNGLESPGHPLTGSPFSEAVHRLSQLIPAEIRSRYEVESTVREGEVYREVLSYAAEKEVDLICLGSHSGSFNLQTIFGSNVERVLREAPCPVLITRPIKWKIVEI